MQLIEGLPEGPLAIYSPSDDPDDRVLAVISEEFDGEANLIVPVINERIHRISGTILVKASEGRGAGTYRPYAPPPDAAFVQANPDEPQAAEAGTIPAIDETKALDVETNQASAETELPAVEAPVEAPAVDPATLPSEQAE